MSLAKPFNVDNDGVSCRTLKYQYQQTSAANLMRTGSFGATGVIIGGDNLLRIRKLTPKECWRLQGWKDEDFEKAKSVCSDSQLYKQAGNGVSVNISEVIGRRLKEIELEEQGE